MTPDEANDDLAARLLSARLSAADLVEAVYHGTDTALEGFVGRRSLFVVVGSAGAMVLLFPHPVPIEVLDGVRPGVAPLVDFSDIKRVGSVLDDESPSGAT